jgi:hypothetical protein
LIEQVYANFYLIIVPNNEETKEKPPFLDGYWYKTSRACGPKSLKDILESSRSLRAYNTKIQF